MTVLQEEREQTQRPEKHLVVWAWVAIGLVPVGVALSVVALFALASVMNVELFPATESEGASFGQGLILSLVSGVVAVAAPIVALILSVKAMRGGERSAKAAQRVAIGLLVAVCAVQLFTVGVVVGVIGMVVVGFVLAGALRRRQK